MFFFSLINFYSFYSSSSSWLKCGCCSIYNKWNEMKKKKKKKKSGNSEQVPCLLNTSGGGWKSTGTMLSRASSHVCVGPHVSSIKNSTVDGFTLHTNKHKLNQRATLYSSFSSLPCHWPAKSSCQVHSTQIRAVRRAVYYLIFQRFGCFTCYLLCARTPTIGWELKLFYYLYQTYTKRGTNWRNYSDDHIERRARCFDSRKWEKKMLKKN